MPVVLCCMRALIPQVMSLLKERSVKRAYWPLTSLSVEHNKFERKNSQEGLLAIDITIFWACLSRNTCMHWIGSLSLFLCKLSRILQFLSQILQFLSQICLSFSVNCPESYNFCPTSCLSFEHNNFTFETHYFIGVWVYKGLYAKQGVHKRAF